MDILGTFTGEATLIELLRKRQLDLGLSNEGLEHVCGFAGGAVDKYLGPSRTKAPTAAPLARLMDGLGLRGQLVVDAARTAQVTRAGKRQARRAHPSNRISKVALKKARPVVLGELARTAAAAGWKRTTPEARAEVIHRLNSARLAKRLARTTA
jgi:hypothetical protein